MLKKAKKNGEIGGIPSHESSLVLRKGKKMDKIGGKSSQRSSLELASLAFLVTKAGSSPKNL